MQILEYFCGISLRVFVEAKWFDLTECICIIVLLGVKKMLKVERTWSVHI